MTGRIFARLAAAVAALIAACLTASPAVAANCYFATSQGSTGPADWQTYCWLDLTSYNDSTARSWSGQNFSYTLPDGTVMTFNMRVSGTVMTSATIPSWSGAAVGNTAFLGIAGRPVLYQTDGGTSNVTISSISLTPPTSGAITNYMFVAADGESSNGGESMSFTTNGGAWQMLDQAGPTSGSLFPGQSGVGTSTFNISGVGGTVGAYIVGSTAPGQVSASMVGSGLQGMMFAVRFASVRLNTQIAGTRVDTSDQFNFRITATATGSQLASGTSTGGGLGPFTAASLSSTAALPITLTQAMAGGSASALTQYRTMLTCTNAASTSTPLPVNVETTSYNFGALQFGDAVSCLFTETPYPHLRLSKTLTNNRKYTGDQFVMSIMEGEDVVATTTTTGNNSTVNNGTTARTQVSVGTTYLFIEEGTSSTEMDQYTATMSCTNQWSGSTTVLPTAPGGEVTPQMGDVINCTIANTARATNAKLSVVKMSQLVSDPVNGTINPMTIPGAVVRYTISIQNSGNQRPDSNSIFIVDEVPPDLSIGSAASPVFTDGSTSSGLDFDSSTGIRFSSSTTKPTSWNACNYTPVAAYDPAVTYVCLRPTGRMNRSTGTPPNFSITLLGRVD